MSLELFLTSPKLSGMFLSQVTLLLIHSFKYLITKAASQPLKDNNQVNKIIEQALLVLSLAIEVMSNLGLGLL